ncbi:hypothetical protein OJ997_22880 [Solirubrobacter phytolaccae]|uniref:Uncharacterized protein n=1 Tax=Solirubrobacter phytolaccae TaxID=1404360 RepID=A0A9X3NB68_9ACTN|nr:ABC-three component system middle component 1 [Solirubrobacter phytolaccae]MDA0183173.1 hypothetical protein [Solirubrobacter phytolaccae]
MNKLREELASIGRVLETGGFAVETRALQRLGATLLAETPHALVLVTEAEWDTVVQTVEDAQATLTEIAGREPSPRSWDLYVIVAIRTAADAANDLIREQLEHDTRYARKLILAGPAIEEDEAVTRALLPLLPLRATESISLENPLDAVRQALLADGQDEALVKAAMRSFEATGEVKIP